MKKEMISAWFDIILMPIKLTYYWQEEDIYEPERHYVQVEELFIDGVAQQIARGIDESIMNAIEVGNEFLDASRNPPPYEERMVPGIRCLSGINLQPDPNSEMSKIKGMAIA